MGPDAMILVLKSIEIQWNPNQNPNKLFCGYRQNDSKVYTEKKKTQNSQHNIEEEQARIKIARRNANNLRYADDTTLMAESEEELKSLLMKVKEESEKLA